MGALKSSVGDETTEGRSGGTGPRLSDTGTIQSPVRDSINNWVMEWPLEPRYGVTPRAPTRGVVVVVKDG